MLQRIRELLLIGLISFLIVSLWELRQWSQEQAPAIQATLTHLEATTGTAQAITSDAKPILHQILLNSDGAIGETKNAMKAFAQTSRAVRDEQQDITNSTMLIMGETSKTIQNLNQQVGDVGEQLRYTLSSLESTSKSGKSAMDDLDRRINDPAITETLQNAASMTSYASLILGDGQRKFHSLLYPEPYTGKFRTFHNALRLGKGLIQYSEPAYYLFSILK